MEEDCHNESMYRCNISAEGISGPAGSAQIVVLSLLFGVIGAVGIVGNFMVALAILGDRRMKKSTTNLFILNMAVADEMIMVFGVPEIVQFMMNRGWVLGLVICRVDRYLLVTGLYVSVATLIAVCVERYLAIVMPLKAHMFCSRRRVLMAIGCIWPLAAILALPTALFNTIAGESVKFCVTVFPGDHYKYFRIYKYTEFFLFYLCPLVLQIALYSVTIKRLFFDVDKLHEGLPRKGMAHSENDKSFDTLKSRRGVVKMLISCVVIYFVSYSPHQVLLVYNTFSATHFNETWPFLVFVMIIAYINSAANPVLYGIFSENYRKRYTAILCKCCHLTKHNLHRFSSSYGGSMAFQSTRITSTRRGLGTDL